MPDAAPRLSAARAVSARAVALGLAGAATVCALTPVNNYKISATLIGGNQFPIAAIFVLLMLVLGVNVVLRRFRPRVAFQPGELLTVWTLILVASGIPSSGMMRTFIPNLPAPHYFSDTKNNWEALVWGATPAWLRMKDTAAANAFFTGYGRGQEQIPWAAWAGPLFFWGLYAVCFLVASFCVASLLRKQWVENEKFAFPLVTLPLLVSEEPGENRLLPDLLRQPLLWLAVGVCTILHTTRGLHLLYPALPDIVTSWDLQSLFTSPPWNQIGLMQAALFLLVVGLSYLLPAEVCFSLWFFFLFYKAEILLAGAYNWQTPAPIGFYSQKLFHALQAFGGAIALTTWTLWSARRHLRSVWTKAWEPGAANIDDRGELLSPRATALGIGLSFGGMALWLHLAGVPAGMIALSLLLTLVALVVVSWAVCQAGMLFMAMPFTALDVLGSTLGTARLPLPALYTTYRVDNSFIYNTREMLIPSVLNAQKTAESARFALRPLVWALAASVVVALVVSTIAHLQLPYLNGGGNSMREAYTYRTGPQLPLKFLGSAASIPYAGSLFNLVHMAGGFVGVLGLLIGRATAGWTLHPIGFLASSTHAAHSLWFSLFLGWAAKSLIQRYGGMRGYRAALPFFLGLIVGDVLNATLWIALGALTNVGYNIMPT